MKRALLYPAIGVLALSLGYGCIKAKAKTVDPTLENRTIELTVYSQDFAQVSEVREVDLDEGAMQLGLTSVSQSIDDSTLMYTWPDGADAQVTSTVTDLGTTSQEALLQQLGGKEVTLVYRGDNGREGERQTAVLEVAQPGNIVVRVGDKLVVNPNATIEAPARGVATMPQLTAQVESAKGGKLPLNLSYMTRGLSWQADYVMTLEDEKSSLECWAKIENHTGVDYPNAKINFVAGSPNRAVVATLDKEKRRMAYDQDNGVFSAGRVPASEAFAGEVIPEVMGELISYPYESKATLRNNQINRVLMMKKPEVTVSRDYSIRLPSPGYYYRQSNDERLKATLAIAFRNEQAAGLGKPLPAGTVRVYEPGKGGAPTFIGSAGIGNTPKDDRVDLTLTEVFNVYARGKLTETKKIDKRHTAYTYKVTVYNEKDKPTDVRLVADFYGSWTISNESMKSAKPTSSSAQWTVSIPAGGEQELTYTVVIG